MLICFTRPVNALILALASHFRMPDLLHKGGSDSGHYQES